MARTMQMQRVGPKPITLSPPPPLFRDSPPPAISPCALFHEIRRNEGTSLERNDSEPSSLISFETTPSITETPTTSIPTTSAPAKSTLMSATPVHRRGVNENSYKNVQQAERYAVTVEIKKHIRSTKADQITNDQRWPMLQKIWQDTLEKRKRRGEKLASEHPEAATKYSKMAHEKQIRSSFAAYLSGGSVANHKYDDGDEDEDDEEAENYIKSEVDTQLHHESSRTSQARSKTITRQDDGISIKHAVAVQRTYNQDRLVAEAKDQEYKPDPAKVVRQWRCAGPFGALVVWPPFEDECDGLKRKAGKDLASDHVKKVKT